MFALVDDFVGQLQQVDFLPLSLQALVDDTHYRLDHLIILDDVLEPIPAFVNHSLFSLQGIVNFEHLPLLPSCYDRIAAIAKVVSSHALQRHGSVGQGHPGHCVDVFVEEKHGDEMLSIEPNHIVYFSIIGAQLIGLELVVSADTKI